MILVTVGTHTQGFDRLVRAADELAATIDEPVIIQHGCSTYIPQNAEHFQLTTSQHMLELTRKARIVITHAAAGTIITCLREGKPLVVVPRLKRFEEHLDDHQQQLADALAVVGKVVSVSEPSGNTLLSAIEQAATLQATYCGPDQLVGTLRTQLAEWTAQKPPSFAG